MSRTIAIITFKDMPDRKFKIKKAQYNTCATPRKICAFYHKDCAGTERYKICTSRTGGLIFKEIKK